jgi:hypothetical protein
VEVFQKSLGRAAGSHIDGGDSPACPTAMTNLSKPHPDVDPELFSILDLGITWELTEFCTVFFSGLNLHGGRQPYYHNSSGVEKEIYYRITLICYPPNQLLNGESSLAFAALPDGSLLKHFKEMRLPLTSPLPPVPNCTQATILKDFKGIMERTSYAEMTVIAFAQQISYYLQQTDPDISLRFDSKKFFDAFSYIGDDGNRTAIGHSDLHPGWSEEVDEDASSNMMNRYGNENIEKVGHFWEAHISECSSVIPSCVLASSGKPCERKGWMVFIFCPVNSYSDDFSHCSVTSERDQKWFVFYEIVLSYVISIYSAIGHLNSISESQGLGEEALESSSNSSDSESNDILERRIQSSSKKRKRMSESSESAHL